MTTFQQAAGTTLYFCFDRLEAQFASKVVMQDMAKPRVIGLLRLKRLARWLKSNPRATYKFEWQTLPGSLDGDSDADQDSL